MILGIDLPRRQVLRVRREVRASPGARARTSRRRPAWTRSATSMQIFFSLYFIMTGIHAAHMVIGIVLMAVILVMAWRGKFSARLLHAGGSLRPLLALRRHRLDFPVSAVVPARRALAAHGSVEALSCRHHIRSLRFRPTSPSSGAAHPDRRSPYFVASQDFGAMNTPIALAVAVIKATLWSWSTSWACATTRR